MKVDLAVLEPGREIESFGSSINERLRKSKSENRSIDVDNIGPKKASGYLFKDVQKLMMYTGGWSVAHIFSSTITSPVSAASHIMKALATLKMFTEWTYNPETMRRVGHIASLIGTVLKSKYNVSDDDYERFRW